MSNSITTQSSLCTFRVGSLTLCVEVSRVQEVIRYQSTTAVPLAGSAIHGLMNLRGQIVTTLDLRKRLGLPERADDKPMMNIVLRSPDGPISLLVDQIGDVVEDAEGSFEQPPETLQGTHRDFIRGAFKRDDGLLLLLDTTKVIEVDSASV